MKGSFFGGLDGFFSCAFPSGPAALGLLFKSTCWKHRGHVCLLLQSVPGDRRGFLSHKSHLVRPSHLGPCKMALEAEIPSCRLIIDVAYKRVGGSGKSMLRQTQCPCHAGRLSSSPDSTGVVAAQLSPQAPNLPGHLREQAAGPGGVPEPPPASRHPSSPHGRKRWGKREQSTSRLPWKFLGCRPQPSPSATSAPQPPSFVNEGEEGSGGEKPLTASQLRE